MSKEDAKPLRTVLFCAGDQADEIQESYESGADAIIIDLEEPRTPLPEEERVKARAVTKEFIDSVNVGDGSPLIFSRVQPPSTGQTLKDLRAVMSPKLAGVLIPKVQSPADIHAADALLTCMEVDNDLPMGTKMIYPILETAQALRQSYEIAMASTRVSYMG